MCRGAVLNMQGEILLLGLGVQGLMEIDSGRRVTGWRGKASDFQLKIKCLDPPSTFHIS